MEWENMEQRYVLGLDIGIASIGWAALALDDYDEPYRIIDLNSRIFSKAENPKDGSSLAAPRRNARSMRRRLRRRRHRLDRVRALLVRAGVLGRDELDKLYDRPVSDIYEIRYAGLHRRLTPEEWSRILLYFTKHRGFKSNRLSESGNDEEGKVKEAVKENKKLLADYHTVGEMLFKDGKFKDHKRNKADDYRMTVSRDMLADEIKQLFAAQRGLGNLYAETDIEGQYAEIFWSQRNFDEGPGGDSPYGGNLIEKMIGKCTLDEKEKRAPKASYSFMRFNLLQKLNHMQIKENGVKRSLTMEERQKLEKLAWQSPILTYARLRKELNLRETERFNDLIYSEDVERTEKKTNFNYAEAYHEIRKVLDKKEKGYIGVLSSDVLDAIGYAFTVFKNEEKVKSYLLSHDVIEEDVILLSENLKPFRKFGHISIRACRCLMPYLEQGMTYDKACQAAGYNFQGRKEAKSKFLSGYMEEVREIPNPVVKRAVSQTIKVINALVQRYGSPVEIHVELAREMSRNFNDRKQMAAQMDKNCKANELVRKELIENGLLQPNGLDIVKWKLYKEQQGVCAYSQQPFDLERLLHDSKYAEVDHILPFSRSFDDSYANKVLVFTEENQHKGNKTPLEYMDGNEIRLNAFETWVQSSIRDFHKRQNLLRKNFVAEEQEWKERHLNDTKYISRFVYNLLREHLKFCSFKTERKRHVLAVNGAITAYVRKRLGISKIRENGDLHHAVDAAIIACVTQGMVNRLQEYSKDGELWEHSHDNKFPEPWRGFRSELESRVSNNPAAKLRAMRVKNYTEEELKNVKTVFVSRMPCHKVRASVHEETIRSPKGLNYGLLIQKVALSKLKLNDDGTAIKDYFNPSSDKLLYHALLMRMQECKAKGESPFAVPFYKPRSDGSQGPLVKKVKIVKKSDAYVKVNGGKGVADNGDMLRIDVFYREEGRGKGYYLVPIYAVDVVKEELPIKAIAAHKPYEAWIDMKPEEFLFSLYPNDLIYIKSEKGFDLNSLVKNDKYKKIPAKIKEQEIIAYYQGTNRSTSAINIINHDNTYQQKSLGIRNVDVIKKMQIDVLGRIIESPKEKRKNFKRMKRDPHAKV